MDVGGGWLERVDFDAGADEWAHVKFNSANTLREVHKGVDRGNHGESIVLGDVATSGAARTDDDSDQRKYGGFFEKESQQYFVYPS